MAYELKSDELDKKGAIELLGIKERQLANHVASGRLPFRYEKGKTSNISVFRVEDVLALKTELNGNIAEVVNPVKHSIASIASPATTNVVQKENIAMLATRKKVASIAQENLATDATQFAEFAATLSAHFAAAISESTKLANIAVQPLLTFGDAALLTGLSERSLRQAAKEGKLKARRQGRADRILRSDLDHYLVEIQK
jgi:excisionase family DNA binding protein